MPEPSVHTLPLVSAMASALLAGLALHFARQREATPALPWWAASLVAEALRLGLDSVSPVLPPASEAVLGHGGHALAALFVLAGICVYVGARRWPRRLAIGAGMASVAIAGGLLHGGAATPVSMVLLTVAAAAFAVGTWLVWRHYRVEHGAGHLVVLLPMLGATVSMLAHIAGNIRFFQQGPRFWDSDWATVTHVSLPLITMLGLVIMAQKRQHTRALAQKGRVEVSEQRFRGIADIASDWIWEMGPDLHFTYISERIEDITGHQPAHFLGKSRADLLGSDPADPDWQRHLEDLQAHRAFRNFVYTSRGADGRSRHLRISGRPIFDGRDGFAGYCGTGTDITAEVEAKRHAAHLDRLLRDAIESMPHGIALYDAHDRLMFRNTALGAIFPKHADELVPGRAFEELLRVAAEAGAFMAEGSELEEFVRIRLAQHRHPPAQPVVHAAPGGRWLQVQDRKMNDGGTVTSWTDITPLKRREQALAILVEGGRGEGSHLDTAAQALATGLGYRWAGVAWLRGAGRAKVAAIWDTGRPGETFEYDLAGTPCGDLHKGHDYCVYPDRVTELFPEDELLVEMGAAAYQGRVVRDADGHAFGHVFAINDAPCTAEPWHKDLVGLIARWVEIALRQEQAEAALRQSRESLANAQRIAGLGNWDWDIVTNELRWSDEIYRIFGLEPQGFGATHDAFLHCVHPEDRPLVQEAVDRALAGAPYAIDHRIVLPDGAERIVHQQGVVEFDRDGHPVFMRGTVQDVTEQRRALAALKQNEERIRAIMENVADGVVAIDQYGLIESLNPAMERIFGYTAAELIGCNISLLMGEPDRSRHDDHLRRYHETGQSKILGIGGREVVGRRRDGSTVDLELVVSEMRRGGKRLFIGALRDITERKKAEEALRQKTAVLELSRFVAAAANEATTVEQALRICIEEVCKSTGWPVGHVYLLADDGSEELAPTDIWYLENPETYAAFRAETMATRFAPGQGMPGRVSVRRTPEWIADVTKQDGDGTCLRRVSEFGIRAELGFPLAIGPEVVGVLEFFSDRPVEPDPVKLEVMAHIGDQLSRVIERARAAQRLLAAKEHAESSSHSKSEFLATMSHELRTPLNAIIGFSQLMSDELFGPVGHPDYKTYIEDILSSGHHLLNIINDILDVSKAAVGKIAMNEEAVDLGEIIKSAVRLVSPEAEENGLLLAVDLPPRKICIRGDPRRLKQVVLNLLSNAVKFTPVGRVEARLRDDRDRGVILQIVDTGVGITPTDLDQIFEPFVQADPTLTRSQDGTGLGLPLSRALVELHGGQLTIESTFGRGTVATVRLPADRVLDSASAA